MSPRILLQYSILAHLLRKYKFFLKLYCDKMINLLTFKIKCVKVFNGEELQSANEVSFFDDMDAVFHFDYP